MDNFYIFLSVLAFAGLVTLMAILSRKLKIGFTLRVVIALLLGLAYGVVIQLIFGVADSSAIEPNDSVKIIEWVNILGSGFTRALQFLIIPLVFVSILSAISRLGKPGQGLKKAGMIIFVLLATTAIAALVAIGTIRIFNLNLDNLVEFTPGTNRPDTLPNIILRLIPSNLFAALSGNNVLPIVFITVILGIAYLDIKKRNPDLGAKFESFLNLAYALVLKLVDYVIGFTPYGVLAIISVRMASTGWELVSQLGIVVIVSYIAMAIMMLIHLGILAISGVGPVRYLKKTAPALIFAFTSRSSSATLPLTIQAQRKLGVSEGNANLAGSFGTCIGQNACAGIFPATVAILVGMIQGWDVWSASFLLPLVLFCVISSIGTAGVGGGATNVSLMVLGLMGLPIELVSVLLTVDFLIDMGRTAVNVNDSILAGFVVCRFEKEIDQDILLDKKSPNEQSIQSDSKQITFEPNLND